MEQGDHASLKLQLPAGPPIIVCVPHLVFGAPLSKRNHEHPKVLFLCPEPVFHPGIHDVLIMSLGLGDPAVNLKVAAVIEEVKQLGPDLVGMQACPFSRLNMRQVDRAVLVADNHVDITPRPDGMHGGFLAAWVNVSL
jgi:hypothetical protein